MVNAVSVPIDISPCQTNQPPTASVSTAAVVMVKPTAGSYAASHFCASKLRSAARSARRANSRPACASSPSARNVRTAATVSCTWSFRSEKRSSDARHASCTWREICQNAHAISGNGSSATRPSRQSTPSVIIATTSTSVSVPSNAARNASPAAISTASTSLVARAIRSPVRWRWKNGGPCSASRSYSSEFHPQPERGAEQREPPAYAQQIDHRAHRDQDRQFAPQRVARQALRHQAVDDVADAARHPYGEHGDAEQHGGGAGVGTPMAPGETANELQQGHGGRVGPDALPGPASRAGARARL